MAFLKKYSLAADAAKESFEAFIILGECRGYVKKYFAAYGAK